MAFWFIVLIIVAFAVYVRTAPSDPARWHRPAAIAGTETKRLKGGYIWRKAVSGDGRAELARLDAAATASPRTTTLAGSVAEGQVTYVTRSAAMGFPDYTTATLQEGADGQTYLEVYGRLRFGRSDFGVNAGRVKGWVADAQL